MIIIPPVKYRRRKRIRDTQQTPAEPPVLVAVAYDPGVSVTLSFDRAIDAAAFEPGTLQVYDSATTGFNWNGMAWAQSDAQTIVVTLTAVGESISPGTTMTVLPENGITSAEGTAWEGATGVEIPFG